MFQEYHLFEETFGRCHDQDKETAHQDFRLSRKKRDQFLLTNHGEQKKEKLQPMLY